MKAHDNFTLTSNHQDLKGFFDFLSTLVVPIALIDEY